MRDYTNFERCNGEPCCVFAERICADNYKELLEKGKDSDGEEVFGEMLDDLLYLAELIDLTPQRWPCIADTNVPA